MNWEMQGDKIIKKRKKINYNIFNIVVQTIVPVKIQLIFVFLS